MFDSTQKASVRRGEIRTKGISDAFVTAYMNGKRIPVYKARQLLKEFGDTILFDYQNKLLPSVGGATQQASKEMVKVKYDKSLLTYRVFIGRFDEPISGEFAFTFLRANKSDLEIVEEDSQKIIQSKELKTYEQAEEKRREFSNFGVQFLSIKAFYNGESIELEKAKQINEE